MAAHLLQGPALAVGVDGATGEVGAAVAAAVLVRDAVLNGWGARSMDTADV